jgi:hypothetical protein
MVGRDEHDDDLAVVSCGMNGFSPGVMRAARLSGLPGITLDTACERFGVEMSALQKLGPTWLRPSREDLVLAVLTDYATLTEGPLPATLDAIASYVDFVEKDGCRADEVQTVVNGLAKHKLIELTPDGWKLLEAWPFLPTAR